MNLPNKEQAYVPPGKLTDYLLLTSHPVGGSKARFLRSVGFNDTNISLLQEGLLKIARLFEVQDRRSTPFGEKFVIEGDLMAPNGNSIRLETVWIIDKGQEQPRLVTAYPR